MRQLYMEKREHNSESLRAYKFTELIIYENNRANWFPPVMVYSVNSKYWWGGPHAPAIVYIEMHIPNAPTHTRIRIPRKHAHAYSLRTLTNAMRHIRTAAYHFPCEKPPISREHRSRWNNIHGTRDAADADAAPLLLLFCQRASSITIAKFSGPASH